MLSLTTANVHTIWLLAFSLIAEIAIFSTGIALLFDRHANSSLISHLSSAVSVDRSIGEVITDFILGAISIGALVYLIGTLIILCSY